jgi:flagellar hook-basal body complex protein FliE
MNAIGAISSIAGVSGVSGVSGISGVSGASGASSISGAAAVPSTAMDGTTGAASSGDSFLNSLSDAFGSLNTQLSSADSSMANFASGGSADLQSVMLQMEEASVSLKSAVDVRDKLLEAYQEIMRTQL